MEWAIGHMGAGNKGPEESMTGAVAARTTGILPWIPQ